jgi:Mg-chelatase subunit ChlD
MSLNGQIVFERTEYNFGDLNPNSIAVFHFTVQGPDKAALLRASKSDIIHLKMPRGYLEPGRKDSILIWITPNVIGDFTEEITLLSTNKDPIELTISGTINDLASCPDFSGSKIEQANTKNIIKIIDANTKEPIYGANIKLEAQSSNFRKGGMTNRKGELSQFLSSDFYNINVSANQYLHREITILIRKNDPPVIIELEKPLIVESEIEDTINEATTGNYSEDEWKDLQTVLEAGKLVKENPDSIPDVIQYEELPIKDYAPNHIIFLLDVSSSMNVRNRLEMLQQSMRALIKILRPIDTVSIVTYAQVQEVVAEAITGDQTDSLLAIIDSLKTKGGTYGVAGMRKAYEIAFEHFNENGNNQILLATDGQFNGEDITEMQLVKMLRGNANKGIKMSIIGFGKDTDYLKTMKRYAAYGKGEFIHITEEKDIDNLLIEEIKKQSRY